MVENKIQVSSTSVKPNGDVFINLPGDENRDKMVPLLAEKSHNTVVKVKAKMPTISILNVDSFDNKENFISKIKQQNPEIKSKMEAGSEFSIVFVKKPSLEHPDRNDYQIVARVDESSRECLKKNNNKLYIQGIRI